MAAGKSMSPAKTSAERQREFRQRKASEQNATEVRGVFAHPEDHSEIKEAAAKIARRRARMEKRAQQPKHHRKD
jgi:hypothetical protein